jgi:hypothetical protein
MDASRGGWANPLATDNGGPPRTAATRVAVDVAELNQPPVLDAVPDQVVDEGTLFTLPLTATDADLPPNRLTFTLGPDAPEGATLAEDGGFSWIPPETLGGTTVTISVRVTDDGEPLLSNARSSRRRR